MGPSGDVEGTVVRVSRHKETNLMETRPSAPLRTPAQMSVIRLTSIFLLFLNLNQNFKMKMPSQSLFIFWFRLNWH